jgi:hypothetical protein
MEDFGKNRPPKADERSAPEQAGREPAYPESIEKMSEKWRSLRRQGVENDDRGFFERNSLAIGLFIGLLIIALLIVIGGFTFLVWNAR